MHSSLQSTLGLYPLFPHRTGALLHWSLIDCLYERNCLLLLGHSVAESPAAERPASATGVPLAEFGAIKVLIEPLSRKRVRIKWLMHVDLKAQSLPQASGARP